MKSGVGTGSHGGQCAICASNDPAKTKVCYECHGHDHDSADHEREPGCECACRKVLA